MKVDKLVGYPQGVVLSNVSVATKSGLTLKADFVYHSSDRDGLYHSFKVTEKHVYLLQNNSKFLID